MPKIQYTSRTPCQVDFPPSLKRKAVGSLHLRPGAVVELSVGELERIRSLKDVSRFCLEIGPKVETPEPEATNEEAPKANEEASKAKPSKK